MLSPGPKRTTHDLRIRIRARMGIPTNENAIEITTPEIGCAFPKFIGQIRARFNGSYVCRRYFLGYHAVPIPRRKRLAQSGICWRPRWSNYCFARPDKL